MSYARPPLTTRWPPPRTPTRSSCSPSAGPVLRVENDTVIIDMLAASKWLFERLSLSSLTGRIANDRALHFELVVRTLWTRHSGNLSLSAWSTGVPLKFGGRAVTDLTLSARSPPTREYSPGPRHSTWLKPSTVTQRYRGCAPASGGTCTPSAAALLSDLSRCVRRWRAWSTRIRSQTGCDRRLGSR